jgi:serine/threonine-protein kinase HipA
LTLGGTKRWPQTKALLAFARAHCAISTARANELMAEVRFGVMRAQGEMNHYMHKHASFQKIGSLMLAEWEKGLQLSIH